jgi:hypothetical protein
LSGFGTLGYAWGHDDALLFARELAQETSTHTNRGWKSDSRLGLQANLNLAPDFDAVVQWVARDKAGASFANSFEWAFLSYRPTHDTTIRVGRIGTDLFALSDYRNVGYAYPWARPNKEFYGWIPIYALDGIDAATSFELGGMRLRPKLYYGRTSGPVPFFGGTYDFRANNLHGITLLAETGPWRIRANHSRLTVDRELPLEDLTSALRVATPLWPAADELARQISIQGSGVRYSSLGAAYESDALQVQGELSHTTAERAFLPQGWRGYLSLAYRLGEMQPYLVLARSTDPERLRAIAPAGLPPELGLDALAGYTTEVLRATRVRQSTLSAGIRWDFATQMAFKLQVDRARLERDGAGLWGINVPTWPGGMTTVWSAGVDFVF